jgi:hypothetical protein
MTAAEIITPGFDYDSLPTDIRAEAKAVAERIKARMTASVIDTGRDLLQVKGRLDHGQFGKWLSAEFGLTERTAQNYMAAAELVGKYETVSVLQPRSLYLLAAPSTPEPVKQQVVDRLAGGEVISDRAVKEMVDDAKLQVQQDRCRAGRRDRKVTIPWSAPSAARILAERLPRSLCLELVEALQKRLTTQTSATPPASAQWRNAADAVKALSIDEFAAFKTWFHSYIGSRI